MMDCSQFRELLPDLDRPGELPAEVRDRAVVHAELCGDCGQLLTESESLDADLRRLAVDGGHVQASMRMEGQLLRAFREQRAVAARQTTRRLAAAIGIAAMVLLAAGMWMYHSMPRSRGPVFINVGNVNQPAALKPSALDGAGHAPQVAKEQGSRSVQGRSSSLKAVGKSASDNSSLVASEDASAFIPLPDADYPVTLDDGAVVRVEMPRADLAAFGLPVEAMEGDGTVRADLIVSADGTPQAIRLVSQDDADTAAQR